MTILVKFTLETFKVTNKLNNDFEHYYKNSEEETTKYTSTDSESSLTELLLGAILCVFVSCFQFLCFLLFQ